MRSKKESKIPALHFQNIAISIRMKDDLQLFLLAFTTSLVQRKNAMDKTMADKLIYIPNNDTQNYPFCRLQLEVKYLDT